MDDNYRLTGQRHYQFTSQRRGAKVINSIEQALLSAINSKNGAKVINSIEQALLSAINSKDSDKFNGNLQKSESSQTNEIDKENFIKQLQKKMRLHGQQTFHTITYKNTVLSLFENYHKFTAEDVIIHHEFCTEEPLPEIDPVTNLETQPS